ncbi:hypothetical protein WME89_22730 [Sorangium sp. So ce321]|uniref:hypothetical protein n=1 Tax=Sorangium sp. So ce321 TaxID=3133300 RepID=UPI003F6204CA
MSSKAEGKASPLLIGGARDEGGAGGARARGTARRRRACIQLSSWVIPAASAVAALHLAGCWPLSYSERCEDDVRYCPSGGTAGGTVDPGPECSGDPTQDANIVTDRCVVFASASVPSGGDGTKARPYASLAEAIEKAAGKKPVLACSSDAFDSRGTFKESVTIGVAAEVLGGFDCNAGWSWSAEARSMIEAPADRVALTLTEDAGGTRVQGFAIRAVDATESGGSSIGVAVADIEAALTKVAVTAGNGMAGATGETPEAALGGTSAPAVVSNACVGPAAVFPGEAGVTECDDGESRGGLGGLGGTPGMEEGNGQNGQDGTPLPAENPDGTGLGGAGQLASQSNCARGEDGASGAAGSPGLPGNDSDTALTLAGPVGGNGRSGTSGTRGQGGGGGGGTKGGLFCPAGANTVEGVGASGGGGGAGGCGGRAGTGGKAGGSSIGIVSLGNKLALTDVTVTVGKAGSGGMGGDGKPGGLGGMGAAGGEPSGKVGSKQGCTGGTGGAGGDGGPGGGGRGGHALGIAYAATPSQAPALSVVGEGTAGDGGPAGLGGPAESNGAAGLSGACWDFSANASCPQQ